MITDVFAVLFVAGAAAIAVWTVMRRPAWAPDDYRSALIHIGFSMVAMYVLVPEVKMVLGVVPEPFRAHISLFVLLLPALVYRLVSMIWLLRLAQSSLGSALR